MRRKKTAKKNTIKIPALVINDEIREHHPSLEVWRDAWSGFIIFFYVGTRRPTLDGGFALTAENSATWRPLGVWRRAAE